MKLSHEHKGHTLTITESIENGNKVLHIDMDSGLADNMQLVANEDGDITILRVEGKYQIDALISALIKFKQMDF